MDMNNNNNSNNDDGDNTLYVASVTINNQNNELYIYLVIVKYINELKLFRIVLYTCTFVQKL